MKATLPVSPGARANRDVISWIAARGFLPYEGLVDRFPFVSAMARTLSYLGRIKPLLTTSPNQIAFIWALRGTIAAGVPLLLLPVLGFGLPSHFVAVGALNTSMVDIGGSYRSRLIAMAFKCGLAARSGSRISGQGTMVDSDRADVFRRGGFRAGACERSRWDSIGPDGWRSVPDRDQCPCRPARDTPIGSAVFGGRPLDDRRRAHILANSSVQAPRARGRRRLGNDCISYRRRARCSGALDERCSTQTTGAHAGQESPSIARSGGAGAGNSWNAPCRALGSGDDNCSTYDLGSRGFADRSGRRDARRNARRGRFARSAAG